MSVVYIIDEEYHFAENVAAILRIEGYEAIRFPDATEAYCYFLENGPATSAYHMLVDVSLAPGDDRKRFGAEVTEGFMKTGIVLVRELMRVQSELFRASNTVLYTAHYTKPLWGDIGEFCKQNGFRSWQKRPDAEPEDFLRLVEGRA